MRSSLLVLAAAAWVVSATASPLQKRQAASTDANDATITTALADLETTIPAACTTSCATLLTSIQGCQGQTTLTIGQCICTTDFLNTVLPPCAGCMADILGSIQPTTDLNNINTACAAVSLTSGAVVAPTSTDSSITPSPSVVTVYADPTSTYSFSYNATTAPPAATQTTEWPTQTKSSNVFTGAAAREARPAGTVGAVLGAVVAMGLGALVLA